MAVPNSSKMLFKVVGFDYLFLLITKVLLNE